MRCYVHGSVHGKILQRKEMQSNVTFMQASQYTCHVKVAYNSPSESQTHLLDRNFDIKPVLELYNKHTSLYMAAFLPWTDGTKIQRKVGAS